MLNVKNYIKFLILFILLFLYIGICTNLTMKEKYEDVLNYKTNVTSPKIQVEESKASYSNGYIKGFIENDTGEHIRNKYLQFDFYDKDGIYVGTKSKQINYFNVKEKISFDIQYDFTNVGNIEISFVDEVIKPKTQISKLIDIDKIGNSVDKLITKLESK